MTSANNQKHQRSKSPLKRKRQTFIEAHGLMIMRRKSPSLSETNFSRKARNRKLNIWCIESNRKFQARKKYRPTISSRSTLQKVARNRPKCLHTLWLATKVAHLLTSRLNSTLSRISTRRKIYKKVGDSDWRKGKQQQSSWLKISSSWSQNILS